MAGTLYGKNSGQKDTAERFCKILRDGAGASGCGADGRRSRGRGYGKKLTDQPKELPKGINFGWYLNIWINVLHNEERIFWRTMNPARCAALYGEYFKLMEPRRLPEQKAKKPEQNEPKSLAAYLMGGG